VTYLGMLVRRAEAADAMSVAGVHVRSWQVAYRGLLPDAYLDGLRAEDRAERYDFAATGPLRPQTMVAVEAGLIRGFATTTPARDPEMAGYGELCALYVDPEHWGRRIGLALLSAARERFAAMGVASAYLWVLRGNTRADRFYRFDQWIPDGGERSDLVWGVKVNEIRYRRVL
jgi:ribosomal protein S18 acetylase RimI-like enzyme